MQDVDLHWSHLTDANPGALSPDEMDRAARFHFARDRDRFIAARSALRHILSPYLGLEPAAIKFSYNDHAKPLVPSVHFNISHSHGLALCAVSRSREVGVDIERIDRTRPVIDVADHFFAPGEIAALRGLAEDLQVEAFFRCWTRKEAYIKARGQGLSISLATFEVSIGETAEFLHGAEGWSIESLGAPPGYAGALVARDSQV